MPYIPSTDEERAEMLSTIGVSSVQELWELAQVNEDYPEFHKISEGQSEFEVMNHLNLLSQQNANEFPCFIGAGAYDHFVPTAIGDIAGRGEFLTSYTPYQPEVSQGTLQTVYEYQSLMCRLTGMEVSNASMYDGGTALFEALLMSLRITRKRKKILIAGSVNPAYKNLINCSCHNLDIDIEYIFAESAEKIDIAIRESLDETIAGVIVQYPDFLGEIYDWTELVAKISANKSVPICSTYPAALALLKSPGEMGFEIVTGDAQCLGMPVSFGGPYLGFMCTTKKNMRKMPGRICGRTVDVHGKEGFVLTLQAREQHIRRELAMSNICTNQALCATMSVIYMGLVGKSGFHEIGQTCHDKAVYAKEKLTKIPGVKAVGEGSFFNEFVIELPENASEIAKKMLAKKILCGYPLGKDFQGRENQLLIALTEKRTKSEIDYFAETLEALLCR